MPKKILTLILITLIIAILGVGYYLFFIKKPAEKTTETPGTEDFLPFGEGGQTQNTPTENEPVFNEPQNEVSEIPKLVRISKDPVAGAGIFEKDGKNFIRFVDRATGHIYEAVRESAENKRLSNNTIPKVYEAYWGAKGDTTLVRYLRDNSNDIETFSIKISQTTPTETFGNIQGNYLARNIKSLAISPTGESVFYLTPTSSGSDGIISKLDGTGKIQSFSSPLKEWNANWPSLNTISLLTKPSGLSTGYLYFLNLKTKVTEKVLGPISGLTALVNISSDKVIYSSSPQGTIRTFIKNLKTGTDFELSAKTLPEKCVWSKTDSDIVYCAVPKYIDSNVYPDTWYQGTASFSDDLWKIDAKTGESSIIATMGPGNGEDTDVMNPEISQNDDEIIFTNKKTLSLWSVWIRE